MTGLTLADAARMIRDAVKDRSYVTTTALGGAVMDELPAWGVE